MSTARDRVEAQRAGFVAGLYAASGMSTEKWRGWRAAALAQAEREYPLPTYERPRVITHGSKHYKVVDGFLWIRDDRGPLPAQEWLKLKSSSRAHALEILNLWDKPTETVEAP